MQKDIIEITLTNKEDYLNHFNHKRISAELSNYILDESKTFKIKDNIKIHIFHKFFMSEDEQKQLKQIIKENYNNSIQELYTIVNKSKIINLYLFIIGIIFLIFELFLNIIPVISELILIFGWVFIWESIYNSCFGEFKNEIMIRRLKKLKTCEIIFEKI